METPREENAIHFESSSDLHRGESIDSANIFERFIGTGRLRVRGEKPFGHTDAYNQIVEWHQTGGTAIHYLTRRQFEYFGHRHRCKAFVGTRSNGHPILSIRNYFARRLSCQWQYVDKSKNNWKSIFRWHDICHRFVETEHHLFGAGRIQKSSRNKWLVWPTESNDNSQRANTRRYVTRFGRCQLPD